MRLRHGLSVALLPALAMLPSGSGGLRAASQQAVAATATASSPERALLDRYCVTCHNQRARTGNLTLDTMDVGHVAANADVWEKVVRKLRGGLMPPPGMPRPDQATLTGFASRLERSLDE